MAFSKLCPTICLIILFANLVYSKENLKIVTIRDTDDLVTFNSLKQIWDEISTNTPGFDITDTDVVVNRSDASLALNQFCGASAEGIQFVLDFSLDPLEDIRKKTMENSIPYIRVDVSLKPYIRVIQSFIRYMNGTDAVIIVTTARELDETLFQLIEKSEFRSIILDKIEPNELKLLHDLRPIPSHIFVIGSTSNLNDMTDKLLQFKSMERRPRSWNFFFTDFNFLDYKYLGINEYANYFFPNKNICCKLMNLKNNCQCNTETNIQLIALHFVIREIINFLVNENIPLKSIDCEQNNTIADELISEISYDDLKFTSSDAFEWKDDSVEFLPSYTIERAEHPEDLEQIAEVDKRNLTLFPDAELTYKRFFRIGIAYAIPWTYPKTDPRTKQTVLNEKGQPVWEGYCIELIARMSEIMDFDYELVYPKEDNFGRRVKGKWTGVVGDLVTGDTDIAVSALKMTAEREEVIDFVAPYFDQTGISIVIRKAVRKTSLFKFMTVLRIEVWMSILGALTATALLVWLLDKYSPYSARNNQEVYTYPVRHFTLKESFWFALTSFTPQGGGEAPKAPSGRILVAAYWLFVVLMLATFTANLAAFLTVERMQTPVQSLEQLARQSRINYTVVEGSDTHQYFINMKFAEDTLYRMWKEITLNSTSDEIQYRVWDYPIKEQYGHILLAINTSIPVKNAAEGFYQVNIHENADFAFIHDSAEIKYEISRNCNLTEVGEVFAEQPYAIAIQQGSHLQDEISRIILDLQKERFFELLSAKYWNNSAKGVCPNSDDNEGISLESLGGVFIATLFGLALAMVTLVGEVIYYRRKERKSNQVVEVKPIMQPNLENTNKENEKKKMGPLKLFTSKMDNRVTIGDQFVPSSQSLNKLSIDKPRLRF